MSNEKASLAMAPILYPGPRCSRWRRGSKERCYSGFARGRVPERPKGAVCKIAGVAYRGSNPLPPTTTPRPLIDISGFELSKRPTSGHVIDPRPRNPAHLSFGMWSDRRGKSVVDAKQKGAEAH